MPDFAEAKGKHIKTKPSEEFFSLQRHQLLFGRIAVIFVSERSVGSVLEKFRRIHKRRISLEELARELNPVIRGVINYYCKFWSYHTHELWNQQNKRLKKWVKWEKGLYKMASVRWLKQKYKTQPDLFAHWKLERP